MDPRSEWIAEPRGSSARRGLSDSTPGVTGRAGTRCTGACPDSLCRQQQQQQQQQQQLHVGPHPPQELWCHPAALPLQRFEPWIERDGSTRIQPRIPEACAAPLAATAAAHDMRFGARDQCCWDCRRPASEGAIGDTRLRSGTESASHGGAGFSVNVPQFSLPPAEGVSQVSVMSPDHLGLGPQGEGALSDPNETRKTIGLPDDCRSIFITYSVDTCALMGPFAEFLTKQGFRPAPSVLIIIAISPGYKEDIERTGVDRHSQHTKYIYSMMQNEFIQQGSLNYRFVPVLFHNATQSHVPGWLQNTHVYRWPQDKENLLLRLLREEHYIAPPVPQELTLLIRPVTLSSSATL
ncbi:hypothetical protein NHX12_019039 [Muraenolepis orangiensis]|uniref:SEFIR domain-containing protein n=1 Tax=Muraenolepis orangiensis TaxID=630683 RepID=A0A9Q0EW16_9TELE|nr:hypothetical protein NHX12_019039 [Muraenolepis orangiensis]